MKLIVGLGNPGPKYESTRHNVGFLTVDHLLKDLEPVGKSNWDINEKLKSEIFILDYQPKHGDLEKVILAKPLTYMNNSGMAVGLITEYYKILKSDIWVIYDELDLPLGAMKIRFGGGHAGHHGVESAMKALGTDKFWRFRMGIGEQKSKVTRTARSGQKSKVRPMDQFVLTNFHGSEKSKARNLIKRGAKSLAVALEKGIESAQNQFNTK